MGSKLIKMYFQMQLVQVKVHTRLEVDSADSDRYSLSNEDVLELARYAMTIEAHYGCPMDIEWGKNGVDNKLYILQARPETVKSQESLNNITETFKLKKHSESH